MVAGELIHGLSHPEMGHIYVRRHPEDQYEGTCPYHADCLEGLRPDRLLANVGEFPVWN